MNQVAASPLLVRAAAVHGDREDQPIENNAEPVHLTEDEHFYSEEVHHREYTIIVNAREKHVATKKLSFEAIVALAFPNPPSGQDMIYTVAYRNGVHDQQGTLTTGHSVRIMNGMIFDVTATDRSYGTITGIARGVGPGVTVRRDLR